MGAVQHLADLLKNAVTEARNGGVAARGIVTGNLVTVQGRTYAYEVIVPITVRDGQRVVVQVSAWDNKAYIIG